MTPLHHCAMRSNVELTERLLSIPQIEVDARDHQVPIPIT